MAGYTRQDTANNIANGNVIDADDFDAEYNQIESAFNASSGHVHDGTSGNGAPIEKVGPSQDLVITASKVEPKTTNTLDLGSSGVQFKDAFFDGTVDTDTLTVSGNGTVGGTLGVTGVLTATGGVVGDTTGDLTGDVTGNLTGDVTGDLTGDVTGDLTGNATGNLTGNVTGNVTGDLTGDVTGDLTGNVTGNVTGDLTGDVTGNADTATTLETARTITVAGDVTATATSFDGSSNITLTTSQSNNSVDLGTHTTGNYVENLVAGTGVTLTNNSGEGATPTVAIGQSVGTSDNVTFNNATVNGNLTVNGTTTTVNSNDVNIGDATLTLNSDETGTPTLDAGITVERGTASNKSFFWDESEDEWSVFGERIKAGTFEGNLTGAVTGNATTATTLQTSRTISLTGDVSGSVSFNGGSNVSITATVADDSHNHTISNIDGLQTEIDTKAEKAGSSSQTFSASTLNATTVDLGAWTVTQSGTDLKFAYNGTNRMKLDASGNLTVEGNITAYGSA